MGLIEREKGRIKYLRIDSNGNLYEKSNTQLEGFREHYNSKTGQPCGYRREYPYGLTGYLDYVAVKTWRGSDGTVTTDLLLTFKDYEINEKFCVGIPYVTPKGNLHPHVKSFVKYCYNIDLRKELAFNCFKRKDGDKFQPSELSIGYVDKNAQYGVTLIDRYFKNGQNGWPEATKRKNPVTKQDEADYSLQNEFAVDALGKFLERFNSEIQGARRDISSRYESNQPAQPNQYANQVSTQHAPQAPQVPQNQPVQAPPQPKQYQSAPQAQPQNNQMRVPNVPNAAPQPQYENVPPQFPMPEQEDDLPF